MLIKFISIIKVYVYSRQKAKESLVNNGTVSMRQMLISHAGPVVKILGSGHEKILGQLFSIILN